MDEVHAERVEWTKKMRLLVSPPEILEEDGTINQGWFKYVTTVSFSFLHLWNAHVGDTSLAVAVVEANRYRYVFCRPKMVGKAIEKKKWGDEQKDLLIQVRDANGI